MYARLISRGDEKLSDLEGLLAVDGRLVVDARLVVDGRLVVDARLAEDGRLVVVLDLRLAGAARLVVGFLRVVDFLAGMMWRLRLTVCYTCLNIFFIDFGSIVLGEHNDI